MRHVKNLQPPIYLWPRERGTAAATIVAGQDLKLKSTS